MKILIIGTNSIVSKKLSKILKDKYELFYKNHKLLHINDTNGKHYEVESVSFDVILNLSTLKKGLDSEIYNANIVYPISIIEKISSSATIINIDTTSYEYRYNAYSNTKKIFREWLENSVYKSVNIRIEHMYGYYSKSNITTFLITKMLNSEEIDLSSGEQTRSFVYIDDVVDAIKKCIENVTHIKNNTNIDIVSSEKISIKNLVLKINQLTKSNSKLRFGVIPIEKNEFRKITFSNDELKSFGWNETKTLQEGLLLEMNEVNNEIFKR